MRRLSRFMVRGSCVLTGLVMFCHDARAAGFFIREQSASALGTAFAGVTAAAEDPSHMFFNPAALGFQHGVQAQAVGSPIVPRAKLENATASTVFGNPIGGRSTKGDIAEDAVVPALYGTFEISPQWSLGLGISAPFGLASQYPDGWVGRYHAIDSELRTININPTVAFRPIPQLAVGFGVQIQYAEARLTNAIDFGTIGTLRGIPGLTPGSPATDGKVELEGDDWAAGVTFGIVGDLTPTTRIGFAYRSAVDHTLSGDVDFTPDAAGVGAAISAATGLFRDTGGKADLTTPETFSFGFVQKLGERFDLRGEAALMRWSRFEELRVRFDNPVQPDSVTEENWKDSWFFALGGTFRATDWLRLRIGVAHDQTPIEATYRTPRIPDNDRTWIAFGATFEPAPWFSLDAGYTHIFVEDSEVRLTAAGVGNATRGNLRAQYDSSIDIVTVAGRIRF
jgi:long-chain fatty acid transport protein